ncbi:NAD(+) diphosphatase [Corynebacterium aquilae]|uniref:NAD(+) diphosphatase n=1 Tax=Corynebacterium aquilae TaxID=203263 RepID=UPI001FE9F3DC|nr:NUDIX domain-containing protein [Corynebacterium aquilae]
MARLIHLTPSLQIIVDADGSPHWFDYDPSAGVGAGVCERSAQDDAVVEAAWGARPPIVARVSEGKWARLVDEEELARLAAQVGGEVVALRSMLVDDHPDLLAAAGYVKNQQLHRFHPADGTPLTFDEQGHVGTSARGAAFFPRLDPAVIGLVECRGRILLGRNALRPDYFSLIAGYVSPGETLEAAFAREVLEETGRRVRGVRYVGSQPWPASGALMLGMYGLTDDWEAVAATDGELVETRWASREEIVAGGLPLSPQGSIARTLIEFWTHKTEDFLPQKSLFDS